MSKESKQLARIAAVAEAMTNAPRERDTSREPRKESMPLRGRLVLWIGSSAARSEKARRARRSFTIRGYVGPNGGGKSLAMVNDCLPSLDRGRTVLSTVKLLDHRTGEAHKAYEQFFDFDQLLDLQHADILMDEVVGIANSRSWGGLSQRVQNVLVQLRRRDATLAWTAPNWARADKIIREVSQAVTECRGFFSDTSAQRESGSEIRLWAPRRVFRFRTFDTADFEEWTSGKRDRLDPISSEWLKGPGSRAFASYDTLDSVSVVAHASESGVCQVCEGQIPAKRCRCTVPTLATFLPGHERQLVGQGSVALDQVHSQGSLTSAQDLEASFERVDREAFAGRRAVVMVDEQTAIV